MLADDAGVRRAGEVPHGRRVPVITSRETTRAIQALLDDGPLPCLRHYERMQIDLKAVGDGVVVAPRRQAADADELVAGESGVVGNRAQLVRRPARVAPTAAADVDPEL